MTATGSRSSRFGLAGLHAGHFAFMRAVVQGLDAAAAWQRYLQMDGQPIDARTVARAVATMRDTFAAAAKRYARPGIGRLLAIDPQRVSDVSAMSALPTLEDFAAEAGLEDFSVEEQLVAYQERYGKATQRQSRRRRLIARQLEALEWLEQVIIDIETARPGDDLSRWLNPVLAKRLSQAGINSVAQLAVRIRTRGVRWAHGIPAIGAGKAARIVAWLQSHGPSMGLSLPADFGQRPLPALPDARSLQTTSTVLAPLEKLQLPPQLDGSAGLLRAPAEQCRFAAVTDREAILAWLRTKGEVAKGETMQGSIMPSLKFLSHTQRAYLKEAERFLLWAVIGLGKPLSSITSEDCKNYPAFLADPKPHSLWCAPRGCSRGSENWRPFEGPLSPAAQQRALTIVRSLARFLLDQGYLATNPWDGVGVRVRKIPTSAAEAGGNKRRFTQQQWEFIRQRAHALGQTSANRRLRLALHLLYSMGLRISEAVRATLADLASPAGIPKGEAMQSGWTLSVHGKAGARRLVPVPAEVMVELSAYLSTRGLSLQAEHSGSMPVFLLGRAADLSERAPWAAVAREPIDPRAGITVATLHEQLKLFFSACARALCVEDPDASAALSAASSYWLRHTHGAHAIAAGVSLKVVQRNMGHRSLTTTSRYASG